MEEGIQDFLEILVRVKGIFIFLLFLSIYCEMSLARGVVALLFYVHGKHLRSCWDGQLT